ncbi:MAG TPA: energy transducer TonB, partial [Casimicrobiaceae bacterium]
LVPITQEAPAFPREALAAGLANGNVKARVVVDAKGAVSSVEIVDSSHRAFDRTVREALSHWRFEPGTASRTTTVDVAFKRDQD